MRIKMCCTSHIYYSYSKHTMYFLSCCCDHVFLSVNFAIFTSPMNATTLQGTNARFTCEVDGTDIINITWTSPFNTIIGSDWGNVSLISSSSSTRTSSTLHLYNVQRFSSEGWYTCTSYAFNGTVENIISVETNAFLFVEGNLYCVAFALS